MLMLSKFLIVLDDGATAIDASMIWSIILIIIVLLLIIFGRRLLLLVNGKKIDEDLDEDEFITDEEDTDTKA